MRGLSSAVTLQMVLMLSTSALAFLIPECPRGPGCMDCQTLPGSVFKIFCGRKNDDDLADSSPFFQIQYNRHHVKPPFWTVRILCANTPNWSDFHLGTERKLQYMSEIIFDECDLPQDRSLVSIVNQVIDRDTTSVNTSDASVDSDEDVWDGKMTLRFISRQNLTLTLTHTTFEGFLGFKGIDISGNRLRNVSDNLLQSFNLKTLILDDNDLRSISAEFLNFPQLTHLSLEENKLQIIEETTLTNLPMLQELVVRNNQIKKIESNSLNKNQNLKSIILSGNFFSSHSIAPNLFRNNVKLEKIVLSSNRLNLTTLPKDFFASQVNLIELYLENDGLIVLPPDLLGNLHNLLLLSLADNYLTSIPHGFFDSCKNLSHLDLSQNQIVQLSAGIFSQVLVRLNMAHNQIEYLDPNIFQGMSRLSDVNFQNNRLTFNHILTSTKEMENQSWSAFHHIRNSIEILNLSNNNISKIYSDWLSAPKLEELDLSHNQLTYLSHSSIQFASSETVRLDLSYNNISNIDLDKLDTIRIKRHDAIVELTLGINPVDCNCSIYYLLQYRQRKTSLSSRKLFHITTDSLACAEPSQLRNIPVKELDEKSLVCAAPPKTCPINCRCSLRAWDQAQLIDCSYRHLVEVPATPDLGLGTPVELNLRGNSLKSVSALNQLGYHNLTVLDLSDNQISSLSLRDGSEKLVELYLHGNNLTQLRKEDILLVATSARLTALTLHENPWQCDCETLDFLDFIQTNQSRFTELQRVTCNPGDTPTYKLTRADVCPASVAPIIAGGITFALLLITGILLAAYYRYETEVKVWLFAHHLLPWFVNETEVDRNKVYDAFISYSHQDEDFVVKSLLPKLEEGPRPFKLCVHYRDWLVGEYIAEQIAKSVADSRRTIVVLSRNFLESEWGRMEFRAAHSTALKEGRTRVIIIIYGEIGPIDKLEHELASYLRTNTYVQWGDRWFWEKLRYALPHHDTRAVKMNIHSEIVL